MEHWNDKQVFAAFGQGNMEALSVLFLRYYDHLLHYGLRVVGDREPVEEAIQELFIHLMESPDRYGEVTYVKAYLFKALRNRLLRHLRQAGQRKNTETGWPDCIDIGFSESDLTAAEKEQSQVRELLLEALNNLSWRQRETIYLRYYNGLTTKEIAEIMGMANQTVLNTLYQAMKKIRKFEKLKKFMGYLLPWVLIALSI
jgi:RNA polymerase sigma factor (sigma-70 family)